MASMTLRVLFDMAAAILQDQGFEEWTETEMIGWYNLAARDVVVAAPDANAIIGSVKLASGTKQALPAKALELIRVIRNMGTDGETAGEAVTPTTLELIQAFNRNWNTATATAAIKNAMKAQGAYWYCYPPSDGTYYVEMERSEVPTPITYDDDGDWESAMVGVDENYVDALLHKMLYYTYSKDSDYEERALHHENMFRDGVGLPPKKRQK